MLVKGQKHMKQNYSISNRFYTCDDYLGESHIQAGHKHVTKSKLVKAGSI